MIGKSEFMIPAIAIGIISLYFLLHLFLLIRWSISLRQDIHTVIGKVRAAGASGYSKDLGIASMPRLIQSFVSHLIEIDKTLHRPTDSAAFLPDVEILGWSIHSKYLAAVPSQLLSIGILGTFFSLRGALTNLSDVTIVASRTGEALLSSLVGLTASVVFATALSARSAVLRADLNDLAEILDDTYPVASTEALQMRTYQELVQIYIALPKDMNGVINECVAEFKVYLSSAFVNFEKAWLGSIDQTLKKWVNGFESGALSATQAYQSEMDRLRAAFISAFDRDVQSAGASFSATLRGAVADVRTESVKAFSLGFNEAQKELQTAVNGMALAIGNSASAALRGVQAASTEARTSADHIKNSFEEVQKQIEQVKSTIEISAGKAISAYEKRLRLVIEESAVTTLTVSDAHQQNINAELEALKQWTEALRLQIDRMLADFANTLSTSIDRLMTEKRTKQYQASDFGPES